MRVALIPPLGWERFLSLTNMHLALAIPYLIKNDVYRDAYLAAARRNSWVIMDNGAAEGETVTPGQLVEAADSVMAKEVVLPDVMRDRLQTAGAVHTFLGRYSRPSTNYMAVIQGRNIEELKRATVYFTDEPRVTALGIPRHLLQTVEQRSVRIDLANWIHDNLPERFRIHLLGMSPLWPQEARAANRYAPHIRSCDSSMPFNFAMAGIDLRQRILPEVWRVPMYFEQVHEATDDGLVMRNIETFLEWAGYEATPAR